MALMLYNTASRGKEAFEPLEEGKVRMYVCGVTPYDLSHVGHARSYVAFDVISRILEYLGYKVKYVQNFTDVDDKIIAKAKEEGVDPIELSSRYIEEYHRDMDALGIRRANSYPLVSEKIPEIIKMIKGLVEREVAYEVEGDVYMDITKKEDYGKLSGQDLEDLQAGARVKVNEKKRNVLDFALWKKAGKEEISWSSPWGEGRPGWHIECSVMSMEALGATLDIHGGGQDLIFPHHENEIAQSESYTGKSYVRYWLHNGLVTVDGQKMSKSLGNFVTVKSLLERHQPQALRLLLLSAHYRRPLDFSEKALGDMEKGFLRLQNSMLNIKNALDSLDEKGDSGFQDIIKIARKDFKAALEDDFNVPKGLAVIFEFVRDLNAYLENNPTRKGLEEAMSSFKEFTSVLGLSFEEEVPTIVRELMEVIIRIRAEMRERRDFEKADLVRERLLEIGVSLEDRKKGTFWKFFDQRSGAR
jgi:cysteinyl-tRNA synthetase